MYLQTKFQRSIRVFPYEDEFCRILQNMINDWSMNVIGLNVLSITCVSVLTPPTLKEEVMGLNTTFYNFLISILYNSTESQ